MVRHYKSCPECKIIGQFDEGDLFSAINEYEKQMNDKAYDYSLDIVIYNCFVNDENQVELRADHGHILLRNFIF